MPAIVCNATGTKGKDVTRQASAAWPQYPVGGDVRVDAVRTLVQDHARPGVGVAGVRRGDDVGHVVRLDLQEDQAEPECLDERDIHLDVAEDRSQEINGPARILRNER